MSRRVALLLAVAALLLPAAVPAGPGVLVLGDSYASGEGLPSAAGTCGTEPDLSWGALVAEGLGAADLQLLACSGAEVADLTVGGDLDQPPQLGRAAPADVVLLSIGGNDLGFSEIVTDCLGLAGVGGFGAGAGGFGAEAAPGGEDGPGGGDWTRLVTSGEVDRGCDVGIDELLARIAAFDDPDRFPLPGGATGDLAAVYAAVAQAAVAPGGRLVVVGYPSLFADVWADRYGRRCHGVRVEDAAALQDVVLALDEATATAATTAAGLVGDDVTVEHVSLLAPYAGTTTTTTTTTDGAADHRLCGDGEAWMNGLTVSEGGLDVAALLGQLGGGQGGLDLAALGARPSGSFHPGTAGHAGTAEVVLGVLRG